MASEFRQESKDNTRLRDGESFTDYAARLKAAGETRADAGGDDDGLGESSAGSSREKMLRAKGCAATDDAEPDAAKAQKDFLMRRQSKAKRSTEVPARPPVSQSEAEAEEEGDDDEEGDEEEFDAAKAKAASDARKMGGKR